MAVTKIRNGQINVTTAFDINSQLLSNVATPVSSTDAATKGYVDGVAQGLDVKDSVRVATTANITLSGTQTIDGVAVVANDRVLVKDQTTGSENGIWVCAAGAWARAADANTSAEVTGGMFVFATEGTTNADTGWVLTTNDPITLGTTALTFAQFSGAGTITAGAGMTKTGSTLDVVSANGGIVANADSIALTLDGGTLSVGASGVKVADGGISNTQINASAAIAHSKLAAMTAGYVLLGNASTVPTATQVTGDVTINSSGVTAIGTGVIVNADVSASAAIDFSKLAALAEAKVLIGSAGSVATAQTISGDATLAASGALTLAANVIKEADFVTRETPSGLVNGSNTTYTLANTPVAGTEHVYLNGILQESGAGNDYTISGATITYLTAPATGDKIRVSYLK